MREFRKDESKTCYRIVISGPFDYCIVGFKIGKKVLEARDTKTDHCSLWVEVD